MDQFQWGITHRSGLLTLNQTLLSFPWECCLGLLLNPRNIRSLYITSEMTFSTIFRDKFGQIKWGYGHLAAELLHKLSREKIHEKFRLLQFMGFVYSPAVCKVICCFGLIHIIYADKNIDKLSRNNFFLLKRNCNKKWKKIEKDNKPTSRLCIFFAMNSCSNLWKFKFHSKADSLFITNTPQWLRLYFQKKFF